MFATCPGSSGSLPKAPQLYITTYDKVVAFLIVAAFTAACSFLVAAIVWLMNAIPLTPVPPERTSVSSLGTPVEDSGLESSEVASPEAVSDDSSVANEQPCVTVLEEAVVVIEAATEASSLEALDEEKVERKGLPNEATGNGNGPIGSGLMGGEKSTSAHKSRRWLFEYRSIRSLEQYTKWLESAGIQPGAVLKNPDRLVYLSALTSPKPTIREIASSDGDSEKRFFITWAGGSVDFEKADRELFSRAGVDTSDARIMHFVSPETEQRLEKLELEFFGGTDLSKIRRTVFEIRESGGRIDFVVSRQSLR